MGQWGMADISTPPSSRAFHSIHRHGMVRVAACTPRTHVGDPAANLRETLDLVRRGEEQHVDLMLFPELGLSAYAIDDLHLQDALLEGVERAIGELVQASRELSQVFIVGAPLRRSDCLYNCAIAIHGGEILGVVPKSFLPNYREFYENRWFRPGAGIRDASITVAGRSVPFGTDVIFGASDFAAWTM